LYKVKIHVKRELRLRNDGNPKLGFYRFYLLNSSQRDHSANLFEIGCKKVREEGRDVGGKRLGSPSLRARVFFLKAWQLLKAQGWVFEQAPVVERALVGFERALGCRKDVGGVSNRCGWVSNGWRLSKGHQWFFERVRVVERAPMGF